MTAPQLETLFELPRSAYALRLCPVCGGSLAQPPGDTYVMRRQEWVKIGKSKHPRTRLAELRVSSRQKHIRCPAAMDRTQPIELLTVLPGDREHELHELYAGQHEHGEWFRLEGPLLVWLEWLL